MEGCHEVRGKLEGQLAAKHKNFLIIKSAVCLRRLNLFPQETSTEKQQACSNHKHQTRRTFITHKLVIMKNDDSCVDQAQIGVVQIHDSSKRTEHRLREEIHEGNQIFLTVKKVRGMNEIESLILVPSALDVIPRRQ